MYACHIIHSFYKLHKYYIHSNYDVVGYLDCRIGVDKIELPTTRD